ncbi:hypothetical protein M3Y94_00610800 [Aphelenchoides besseyi]|nr:hypothetical protein M3Y94_00610800 [Aphelenchoides besseyi]KAI6216942.1 hypothetical protein M3Y95_01249800 [Aphelenchoides besseyi]
MATNNPMVVVPVTTTTTDDQLNNVNCCCIIPIRMGVVAIGTIDLIICLGAILLQFFAIYLDWFDILIILTHFLSIAADICLIVGALKKIWILLTPYIITACNFTVNQMMLFLKRITTNTMVYISCVAIALLSTCSFWLFYKNQRLPQMTILSVFAVSVLSALSPVVAIRYRKPAYFLPFVTVQWVLAALIFISQLIMIETVLIHFYRLIRWKATLTSLALNLFTIIVYFVSAFPILRARNEMKRELRTGIRTSKSRSSIMYVDNPNEVLDGTGEEQDLESNKVDGHSSGKEEVIEL